MLIIAAVIRIKQNKVRQLVYKSDDYLGDELMVSRWTAIERKVLLHVFVGAIFSTERNKTND
jgi:hypothetical protein